MFGALQHGSLYRHSESNVSYFKFTVAYQIISIDDKCGIATFPAHFFLVNKHDNLDFHVLVTSAMAQPESAVTRRLKNVKHIILVLSGKGGVGKSSVSTQLALNLYASSPTAKVGILDVDLTGPSIPRMFGVDNQAVHQSSDGWVPVYADGASARMACMSVGFLLKNKGDSVVWRGPKKNGMIRQFLSDVRWGELDYLVIDTPPGSWPCVDC